MDFFKFFKKKQKSSCVKNNNEIDDKMKENKDQQNVDPIAAMAQNIGSSEVKMKTYDILVFDIDPDTGRQKQTPINGVKATSPQELIGLYASCDQRIRILKEYDTNPPQIQPQIPPPPPDVQRILDSPSETKEPTHQTIEEKIDDIIENPRRATKPYYFEVGGIKCKMEGDHVYQEQWCRVDASKYRLISDTNNKEISMSGKHLETLKWVLIEENEGKEND